MKVCLINTLYYPYHVGGAEKSVQLLAEHLAASGNEVIVVSASPAQRKKRRINSVKVYYIGLKNLYWPFRDRPVPALVRFFWHTIDTHNPFMAREVGHILDSEEPDLVHTNNLTCFSTAVWRAIQRRGIPLVHTLRDYYLACPSTLMFKNGKNCNHQCLVCRAFSFQRRRASRSVDAVGGISSFILERHAELGFFAGVKLKKVIFNSVAPSEKIGPRNLQNRSLRVGYLGQLAPSKGIELIFSALARFDRGSWEFLVAGKGAQEYETALKARFAGENIRFLGFENPDEFYRKIDVLVVPSLWHEPFGRIIPEAYQFGIPVIGTNRGGIPEIINNGQTGFVFDPDETGSLASAIGLFIANPALVARLRSNVLEAAKKFLTGGICNRYLGLYHQVVSGRS